MISRYMGPHYGNDVEPSRGRHLPAHPARLPAGVRPPRGVPGRVAEAAPGDLHLPLGGDAGVMSGMPMLGRALASLTRRRFLLGAGAVAGAGAAVAAGVGIDRAVDTGGPAAAGGPAPRRSRRCRSAPSPPACPRGSTPGTPYLAADDQYGNPIAAAVRPAAVLRRQRRTRRRRTRPRARGGAAHARARLPVGARPGCCSPPAGASRTSRTCCTSRRRSRSRRRCRTSSCPRSTTTTCACTSPATTSRGWPRSRPRWCAAPRCPARTARSTSRARCGGARRGPGSSAPGLPARAPGRRRDLRRRSRVRPPHRCSWGSSRA